MRVIQVLHHSLTPFKPDADPRTYEEDWNVKVAKQLAERDGEHTFECWRPEHTFSESYERVDDDITYRVFPSTYLHPKVEYSQAMRRALADAAREDDVLFHFHGLYNYFTYVLLATVGERAPIVMQSHGGDPAVPSVTYGSLVSRLSAVAEYLPQEYAFRKADQIFALTKREAALLSDYGPTTVSPMGVDFDRFRPTETAAARDALDVDVGDEYVVAYIGRLIERKGVDVLIEAADRLAAEGHEFRVLVGGSGPMQDDLEALVARRGLEDRIDFLGHVAEADKVDFYNAANAVCFPSKTEPYGIVPVEALACRTPLVATETGAVPDIVENFGGESLVVRPDDAPALADGLADAITGALDPARIDRESGRRNHGWDAIVDRTLAVYDELPSES
ncbi:glycosyltransferase family 4 protein [Halarchaeum sp. CBA1220]|uniref:glycosyltransferase family 4 protein n=1 Tax=Halarchaeum sp. CBA1220 TaxID=1853682 RepID=UPI000F3AA415|nr:glycosyltransferase family 4 protein [Halarchaeum sp. CBA1220]QLC34407.1 glycosyltransferase family 4 protein [Halarchaeum sp. CBA1220]